MAQIKSSLISMVTSLERAGNTRFLSKTIVPIHGSIELRRVVYQDSILQSKLL